MLAPASFASNTGVVVPQTELTAEPETKKPKVEKQDKVKVAKRVAKDMERWAKTLNQKKENAAFRANPNVLESGMGVAGGSADIGFSVLEKTSSSTPVPQPAASSTVPQANLPSSAPLVAAYGESDSSEDESAEEPDSLDFTKNICNLCKRQLPTPEALTKHAKLSDLHKKNLELWRSNRNAAHTANKPVYRDRAKERRLKYGVTDDPQPSKLKEKYLKSRELAEAASTSGPPEPIGAENVGNRLLQKMGWTEGQGLGKTNQGRTTIIEVIILPSFRLNVYQYLTYNNRFIKISLFLKQRRKYNTKFCSFDKKLYR